MTMVVVVVGAGCRLRGPGLDGCVVLVVVDALPVFCFRRWVPTNLPLPVPWDLRPRVAFNLWCAARVAGRRPPWWRALVRGRVEVVRGPVEVVRGPVEVVRGPLEVGRDRVDV